MPVQPRAKKERKSQAARNIATQPVRGLADTVLEAAQNYLIYEGGNGKTSVAFVDAGGTSASSLGDLEHGTD